jgi:hypothetical protein
VTSYASAPKRLWGRWYKTRRVTVKHEDRKSLCCR